MGEIKSFLVGFASIIGMILAYIIIDNIARFIQSLLGLDYIFAIALIIIGMVIIGFIYGWFYLYPKVLALTKKAPAKETHSDEQYEYKIKEE